MPIISTISFPLDIDDLGVPFLILPNTAFLGEMAPLCIVSNLGATPGAARFITVGTLGAPNAADPWSLAFHWETAGGSIGGAWMLDAFLNLSVRLTCLPFHLYRRLYVYRAFRCLPRADLR